jgi:hypothetical protein
MDEEVTQLARQLAGQRADEALGARAARHWKEAPLIEIVLADEQL